VHSLVVYQIIGKKLDGRNQPLDILVGIRDETGALIDGVTVSVTASGSSQTWSGTLSGVGVGLYYVCNQGAFDGNGGGGVTIDVTATKAGYNSGSGSGTATKGNLLGCP
jgi:hypothetical protein